MKSMCLAAIILTLVTAGCGNINQRLYDDLAKIPGGFSELSVYGGSVWATTSLDALNGRVEGGVFIIEQLIWILDTPFANVKYSLKGFKPDAPVGLPVEAPGGRFK